MLANHIKSQIKYTNVCAGSMTKCGKVHGVGTILKGIHVAAGIGPYSYVCFNYQHRNTRKMYAYIHSTSSTWLEIFSLNQKGKKLEGGESSILLLQTLLAPGHLTKSGCHLWGGGPLIQPYQ